ncbi:MAG: serine/threonine-protein kinase, partial [Myxococcota bacterium]
METQEFPGFEVLRQLGEGGMGVVYLAQQHEPVERQVAVKLLQNRLVSEVARHRFEAEQQTLARLAHPNIAQLFDAGTTDDGVPYFVMEYVEGQSIVEYAKAEKLSVDQRIQLFRQVGRALQYAHQKGVIHRDVKPSNILVQKQSDGPRVKLIDFGVAKATDEAEPGGLTGHGYVGTPAYMPPEAFDGSRDIDTRSDIYSLGVALMELVTGSHPFRKESLAEVAAAHASSKELTALALWNQLDTLTQTVALDERSLTPVTMKTELGGDLGAIITKAISRDREERYDSVANLLADLDRYLNGYPVEARGPGTVYRLRKFIRRHQVSVLASALVVMAILTGTAVAAVQAQRATREAARATREAVRANQQAAVAESTRDFLLEIFELSNPDSALGRSITAKELLD